MFAQHSLRGLLLLSNSQHDEAAMQFIIEKFRPVIRKYAMQLHYDGAESDLVISLIEFVYKLDVRKLQSRSEGELVSFIVHTIRNKKIDIYRKNNKGVEEIGIDSVPAMPDSIDFTETSCFRETIWKLPKKQRAVIIAKYFYGYSDIEIAEMFRVSRQAVNQIKRRAIKALRKDMTEG